MRQNKVSPSIIRLEQPRRRPLRSPIGLALVIALFFGIAYFGDVPTGEPPQEATAQLASPEQHGRSFTVCGSGPRTNCVVDGDTFWLDGTKIRIADIDTPEIHPSRCEHEEQLGQAAKQRLLELLNAGAFELAEEGSDRYGRALRIVLRNGASLGKALVGEGLARAWDGSRHPWCN